MVRVILCAGLWLILELVFEEWLDLVWTSVLVRTKVVIYVTDDVLSLSVNSEDQMRVRLGASARLCVMCCVQLWLCLELA